MHSTFLLIFFFFLSFHIYCALLYIMCKYNILSVGLAEEMGSILGPIKN